jgi:hypothetical protein
MIDSAESPNPEDSAAPLPAAGHRLNQPVTSEDSGCASGLWVCDRRWPPVSIIKSGSDWAGIIVAVAQGRDVMIAGRLRADVPGRTPFSSPVAPRDTSRRANLICAREASSWAS